MLSFFTPSELVRSHRWDFVAPSQHADHAKFIDGTGDCDMSEIFSKWDIDVPLTQNEEGVTCDIVNGNGGGVIEHGGRPCKIAH